MYNYTITTKYAIELAAWALCTLAAVLLIEDTYLIGLILTCSSAYIAAATVMTVTRSQNN